MMDWRPIETAPNEPVLLYFGRVSLKPNGRGIPLQPMVQVGYTAQFPHRQPSHWMPLPEPPASAGEAGTAETTKIGSVHERAPGRPDDVAVSRKDEK